MQNLHAEHLICSAPHLGFSVGSREIECCAVSRNRRRPRNSQSSRQKKDLITGNWSWDGNDVVTGRITSGSAPYKTYFGVINEGNGLSFSFDGYGDKNRNGIFEPGIDVFVGTATGTITESFSQSPIYSGTFEASKITGFASGFSNGTFLGSAQGVGYWFN
jgi:hypothetical protein